MQPLEIAQENQQKAQEDQKMDNEQEGAAAQTEVPATSTEQVAAATDADAKQPETAPVEATPQTPEEIEKEKKEKEELLVRRQKMLLQLADGGAQENDDMDFNEGGNEHAPAEEEAPESLAPDVRESAFG